jgi:hypothetical protein
MDSSESASYPLTKFSSIKFKHYYSQPARQTINATVNNGRQILLIYEDRSLFGGGVPL